MLYYDARNVSRHNGMFSFALKTYQIGFVI
jgi:hypothetical protein